MFGERLKMIRKESGFTQKSLANELFVSQQSVWKWEKNESSPNPETIAKMAQIFGVSTDYLLGRDEKEKEPASGEADGQAGKLAKALGGVGIDVDTLSDNEINRIARMAKVILEE